MSASIEQLDTLIDRIASAPSDLGTVELMVARPARVERLVLKFAELRPGIGLVGDNFLERGEVTVKPHNGCVKFAVVVVQAGSVAPGDPISKR